jgi:DNA-binding beta-propeller fold protein YncE
MRSKSFTVALSLAVSLLAAMAANASPALAQCLPPPLPGESHPCVSSFGRTPSEPFTNPNGIAVDSTTGDVYVADIGTDTVYKFDANGNPVNFSTLGSNALTGGATPAGSFSFPNEPHNPAAIAVDDSTSPSDPSAGDLYVMDADPGHKVIDKFSPSGAYIGQITGPTPEKFSEVLGVGVDASGSVRVYADSAADVFDNAASNIFLMKVAVLPYSGNSSTGVSEHGFAVGPTGDYYPLFSCGCTEKLGANAEPLGRVDTGSLGAPGSDVAVAVDPATGHVYVDDQSSVREWDTGEMNGSLNQVHATNVRLNTGTLVSTFGGLQLSGSAGQGGIAVNGASGNVYVSNPADGKVYVFASTAPAVAVGVPANVTQTGATLEGTVNPHGSAVTSCRFEYDVPGFDWEQELKAPVTSFGQSVPCEQTPAQIGSGTSPVRVSADISGLQPGRLYDFRLNAENANGASLSGGRFVPKGPGFGVKSFEVSFANKDGSTDTQAGSHPYKMSTNIVMNTTVLPNEITADSLYHVQPDGGTFKDVIVDLPPGLVGDPNATAKKCTLAQMDVTGEYLGQSLFPGYEPCPVESAIGELEVEFGANRILGGILREPIYNLVPPRGVAAQLGSHFILPNAFINVGVQAGGDYPVQAATFQAPVVEPVISTRVVVFGVVGTGASRKAFLTLPTGCNGPLRSSISVDSYQNPGHYVNASSVTRNASGQPVGLSGCSKLQFPPTITVSPDTTNASTSSGLTVGVHVSQKAALNPEGLAESSLRDTTVTLPEGVALNPAGADGLEACSEGLAGFEIGRGVNGSGFEEFNKAFEPGVKTALFTPAPVESLQPGVSFCPNGSKIGEVTIHTPLLPNPLKGFVYLASQDANPFGSLVAMYLIAEDPVSGTIIKLTGEVKLSETGQIVTTFENTPDLPFEDLELHFFGGERAPLTTPSRCGTYTTQASFTPWDGNAPVNTSSSFQITSGPNGSPCPGASLPFNPSLTAGTTSIQAGGFSPFTMTMSREDGQQNLQAITLHMPPGLSGLLSGVKLCGEAEANAGTCGPESEIGETIVSVGVGNDPFSVKGGKVFITGPYGGAPFGLSIVNPAKAGPFDLGQVIVRAKIEVDPHTAALTITSDNSGPYKIPQYIDGIPLQIKHVNVTINRPNFTFNPTNCNPMSITGSLSSTEGATSALSVPLQATNCAVLGFKPAFKVSTAGKTSRANGASLSVKLTYPKAPFGSQANIKSVKVDLPKQLPSRLTTLQKACTAAQFNTNPAGCPAASVVGHAKAITPLIPVPLEGPAYFVSHGGEAFPSLIVVLQGYGVTLDLVGTTFISKAGITSSTFKTVPDAPVGSFELTLPEGKFSALAANGNLCASKLAMPTAFVAQNGAVIKQSTPIGVTGCKPAIRIVGHSVKGLHASIRVTVPSAGTLVATGTGIKRSVRRVAKAGTVAIGVTLSGHDLHVLAKNPHQRVNVKVKLRFTPKHGTPLTAYVRLLMG